MAQFERLRVWQEALKLSVMVYELTRPFLSFERFGLSSQMQRASASVGANIAEGQKRSTPRDFRHFICTAEGSLAELQHFLQLAKALGYVQDAPFEVLWAQSVEVEKMLQGLRFRLEKQAGTRLENATDKGPALDVPTSFSETESG